MKIQDLKILGIATVFITGSVSAVPTVYTDEASWLAAIGAATVATEDFESITPGILADGVNAAGLFDIEIDTATSDFDIPAFNNPGNVNGSTDFNGYVCDDVDFCDTFQNDFLFGSSIVGFAGDWQSTTTGSLLNVTINGVTLSFTDYFSGPGDGFLGFVDLDGFTMASFGVDGSSSSAEAYSVDNVRLASASVSVPEPATLSLLLAGLIGIGFARRF